MSQEEINSEKYLCQRGCQLRFKKIKHRANHYRDQHYNYKEPVISTNDYINDDYMDTYEDSSEYYQDQPKLLVFNVSSLETSVFTKSELFSTVFQGIIDTYSIPGEPTRELVRLFQSMLEDNLSSNNIPLEQPQRSC